MSWHFENGPEFQSNSIRSSNSCAKRSNRAGWARNASVRLRKYRMEGVARVPDSRKGRQLWDEVHAIADHKYGCRCKPPGAGATGIQNVDSGLAFPILTISSNGEEIMSHKGFSHIGLSTLDLDKTREFYEDVLGFKPVVCDTK
jgi:hypothetical protein